MADGEAGKICVICGEDCSDRPRTKDPKGRYYCKPCYERARQREQARTRRIAPTPAPALYPDDRVDPTLLAEIAAQSAPPPSPPVVHVDACPGCDHPLPPNARICVNCGVDVKSGRSLVTSRGLDESLIYGNAEQIIRLVSWVSPIGVSPIASEAMGLRKPYTAWAIALLTICISIWFWLSTDAQMNSRKDLMLWAGDAPPSAELIMSLYQMTDWGDERAFRARMRQVDSGEAADEPLGRDPQELVIEAHGSLTPAQQVIGRFRGYQLLTHALLHGDVFHLAGNLVFLLIFGSRVSALVGNVAAAILYPLLAVAAGLAEIASVAGSEPLPMLGASGAIMGMAGMYFVLFPVNRMHMAAWFRWWFYFRMRIWTLRGFWVVLFYVAFDLLYLAIGAETGTAHWAHLGGFAAGAVIALALLFGRLLNAGGGDLVSVILGRHAWKLIGRPGDSERLGLRLPGV